MWKNIPSRVGEAAIFISIDKIIFIIKRWKIYFIWVETCGERL